MTTRRINRQNKISDTVLRVNLDNLAKAKEIEMVISNINFPTAYFRRTGTKCKMVSLYIEAPMGFGFVNSNGSTSRARELGKYSIETIKYYNSRYYIPKDVYRLKLRALNSDPGTSVTVSFRYDNYDLVAMRTDTYNWGMTVKMKET